MYIKNWCIQKNVNWNPRQLHWKINFCQKISYMPNIISLQYSNLLFKVTCDHIYVQIWLVLLKHECHGFPCQCKQERNIHTDYENLINKSLLYCVSFNLSVCYWFFSAIFYSFLFLGWGGGWWWWVSNNYTFWSQTSFEVQWIKILLIID